MFFEIIYLRNIRIFNDIYGIFIYFLYSYLFMFIFGPKFTFRIYSYPLQIQYSSNTALTLVWVAKNISEFNQAQPKLQLHLGSVA